MNRIIAMVASTLFDVPRVLFCCAAVTVHTRPNWSTVLVVSTVVNVSIWPMQNIATEIDSIRMKNGKMVSLRMRWAGMSFSKRSREKTLPTLDHQRASEIILPFLEMPSPASRSRMLKMWNISIDPVFSRIAWISDDSEIFSRCHMIHFQSGLMPTMYYFLCTVGVMWGISCIVRIVLMELRIVLVVSV